MNMEKILGLLYIIFGLLFVIYPIFSSALISMIIGFSLVCFGLSSISMGIVFTEMPLYKYLTIMLGIIAIIFGIMFMFFLNAVPFLVSLQFYIVGFLMIIYGLVGIIFLDDKVYRIISGIGLILGILTVILAAFLAAQPIVIAVIFCFCIIDFLIIVSAFFLFRFKIFEI